MNNVSYKKLEYDKIKDQLISFTMSQGGRVLAEQHEPSTDEAVVKEWLTETAEAAALLKLERVYHYLLWRGLYLF